jgi:hypothetical protein
MTPSSDKTLGSPRVIELSKNFPSLVQPAY